MSLQLTKDEEEEKARCERDDAYDKKMKKEAYDTLPWYKKL